MERNEEKEKLIERRRCLWL